MNTKENLFKQLPNKPLRQNYQRLSQLVVEQLTNWIMNGTLRAGERLNIDELVEKLGVSQVPIREAFRVMEASGLLKSQPYLGVWVASLSKEEIEEIYMLREMLEGTAGRFAARQIEAGEIAELETIQGELEQVLEQDFRKHYEEVLSLNRKFHLQLYATARKPKLNQLINQLWDSIGFYRLILVTSQNYAGRSSGEHKHFIEACKKHDGELLESLIQAALQNHLAILLKELGESYFSASSKNNVSKE